jgi:uncharacterized membrane protein
MKNFYTIIFIFFVSIIGCTNQNEEDFFSDDDCDLENISYLSVVQEIIESKCIACHAQGNMNGPVLDNHENVVKYIDDILFLITDLENIMPPLGATPLTECEILQIQNWYDNEMPF